MTKTQVGLENVDNTADSQKRVSYAESAGSVTWDNVSSKPTFASVATSGKYDDLTGKPTIPSLDNYASKTWVNSQGFLTGHQSLSGYATEEWVKGNFPAVTVCKSFDDLLDIIPEGEVRSVMGMRVAGAFPSLVRPNSANYFNFMVGTTPTVICVWKISRSGGIAYDYTFEQTFGGGPAYVF